MAIQLTVKEGNSERSWDVVDGQQIDINMAKGAEYALIDTRTGETPDGLRVVNNHGQTEIYGSDTFPWVTLHDDGSDTDAAPQPEAAPASPAATLGDNIAIADAAAVADASAPPPADAEHLQADEVAEPTNPNFEGTPSGGSMLLAGGGALLAGGRAAAIGGGSSGANPHYHEPDTSLAPHPATSPEPLAADGNPTGESPAAAPPQPTSTEPQHTPYTLNMNGENLNFDNLLKGGKLDATNHDFDKLTLNAGDLLAHPGTLTLSGDYGDQLDLTGGGWVQDSAAGHGNHYSTYHHGNFTLRVEDDISVSII